MGLIAPHIARRLTGNSYRYIVPLCGMVGMLMVVISDFIGKTVFAPAQLPVGIVVSIIGVPYFLFLLFKTRKR
ncbi:Iron-uptake system permease protein FeuC [compost metagenome]